MKGIALTLLMAVVMANGYSQPADSSHVLQIRQLTTPILFDGVPDEDAWNSHEPFPMIMHLPDFGKTPSQHSDIRLAFDKQYLYLGAVLLDDAPEKIQANTKKRDNMGGDSDWLGLILDTFNDNENGMSFWTTPAGLRTDVAIYNDANVDPYGNQSVSSDWNTFWDVKTKVTDQGWFAEMRIPVSSLRFQEDQGVVTMGLIINRFIPHLNEFHSFPAISNEYESGIWKVSKARDVVFHGLRSKKPLYIAPYVLAGYSEGFDQNEEETEYIYHNNRKFTGGLDLKYGINNNLTMDLTLNTDFAQVEADDQMINLTRFSLFFPEKRQFFLERAAIMDFNTAGQTTMFYSRRIGIDDDHRPVPIIGGVRLIGRKGPWDIGFLNMQTDKSENLPSENFGVLRLKRQVLNHHSYVGNILTSRLGVDGNYNWAYGLDALLNLTGEEYLKLVWGQTFENEGINNAFTIGNARYVLNWQRRRNSGFYYDIYVTGTGKDYNPGIGYMTRYDFHVVAPYLNYTWIMGEQSPIQKHGLRTGSYAFFTQSSKILESGVIGASYNIHFKNFWSVIAEFNYNYENFLESLELSDDAIIPIGQYTFVNCTSKVTTPPSRAFNMIFNLQVGGLYDGRMMTLSVEPNWSISSSIVLGGSYEFNRVAFTTRNQMYLAHICRLKGELMFSTRLSFSAFVQYNSGIHAVISNVRFRYNPREGNDLYIVYNEGANTHLTREEPHLPGLISRTIMLKYTYTFAF